MASGADRITKEQLIKQLRDADDFCAEKIRKRVTSTPPAENVEILQRKAVRAFYLTMIVLLQRPGLNIQELHNEFVSLHLELITALGPKKLSTRLTNVIKNINTFLETDKAAVIKPNEAAVALSFAHASSSRAVQNFVAIKQFLASDHDRAADNLEQAEMLSLLEAETPDQFHKAFNAILSKHPDLDPASLRRVLIEASHELPDLFHQARDAIGAAAAPSPSPVKTTLEEMMLSGDGAASAAAPDVVVRKLAF